MKSYKLTDLRSQYFIYKNPFRTFFSNIPMFFRIRKYKKQRARRGYADCDLWETGGFLNQLMASMLSDLADRANSYPEKLKTIENWQNKLREIAKELEDCDLFSSPEFDTANKYSNEYYEMRYRTGFTDYENLSDEDKLISDNFNNEAEIVYQERTKKRKHALSELNKYWLDLWD